MNVSLNATREGGYYRWKCVMEHPERGPNDCITFWPVARTKEDAEEKARKVYEGWKVKFSSKQEPIPQYKEFTK